MTELKTVKDIKLTIQKKLKKFHHIGILLKFKVGESASKNFNIKRVSKTITDKNLKVKVKFLYDYNNICMN